MGWKPLPNREPPEPSAIRDSLDRVAASLGISDSAAFSTIFLSWQTIVGESLAAHVKPRRFHNGVLVVEVEEPAWATQVRWLGEDLRHRIGEAVGDEVIKGIEVVVRVRDVGEGGSSHV